MFKTLLFTSDGHYSGWKERSEEVAVLSTGEHRCTEEQFFQKEYLTFTKGKIKYSKDLFDQTIVIDAKKKVSLMIDAQAKKMGYDSHLDILSYADDKTSPVFQAEAIAFRVWRTNVWTKYIELENTELLLKKAIWTEQELATALPAFVQ